jgi:hypothetical protein
VNATVKRIVNIGTDPWQVKEFAGTVHFKRSDAAQLKVTALDLNGQPRGPAGSGAEIHLQPTTMYYLITRN